MAASSCHKLLCETLSLCRVLRKETVGKKPIPPAKWVTTDKSEIMTSLQRMHTFDMRAGADNNENAADDSEAAARNELALACPAQTLYFEENMPVLSELLSTYEPIVSEVVRRTSALEERLHRQEPETPTAEAQILEGTGLTRGKIDEMKRNKQFKVSPRSLLGLKSKTDWIFNINIGNVMHLTPISLQDLSVSPQLAHEICRDAVCEKVIVLAISYFSLATECRFRFAEEQGEQDHIDARLWHKAAVESVCSFLPADCPLVGHIVSSYEKHHPLAQEVIVRFCLS